MGDGGGGEGGGRGGGGGWGVPMSHVDYKKGICHPVEFKEHPCRMSLMPKMGCVAVSILGVYTHNMFCSIF